MVENIEEFKDTKKCRRCHRKLTDEQSKKLGFGKICYKKYLSETKNYLFDIEVNNGL